MQYIYEQHIRQQQQHEQQAQQEQQRNNLPIEVEEVDK